MASVAFHLRHSSRIDSQAGSLFIRIIHQRRVLSITTTYRIYPHEWDKASRSIIFPECESPRTKHLLDMEDRMNIDLRRLWQIIDHLEKSGQYTIDNIALKFGVSTKCNMLSVFADKLASELCCSDQYRTARAYHTVAKGLIRFNRGKDIQLEHINANLFGDLKKR